MVSNIVKTLFYSIITIIYSITIDEETLKVVKRMLDNTIVF